MSVGVGGAGSKLASLLDEGQATIVDVSGVELERVDAVSKIRAVAHSSKAQLKGSRKDPQIGREAFQSIKNKALDLIKGQTVFCSTGGGTGNGLCSVILEHLSAIESISITEKKMFAFVVPYAQRESSDFVDNTISFLEGPVSKAIDAGNTGNLIIFSNKVKFERRIPEKAYNNMIIESLNHFLSIPTKGEELKQLDGNIDYEDFCLYKTKPYFNHFCQFNYNQDIPFGKQLKANYNELLLDPEGTIEALFLLELPNPDLTNSFYSILDFFSEEDASPMYSVLYNPNLKKPLVTVSLLYSRKPLELVEDYNAISGKHKRSRVKKSLDQYVTLSKLEVDLTNEAEKVLKASDSENDEVLSVLKRIGKL